MDDRRALPSVGALLQSPAIAGWIERYGRPAVAYIVRDVTSKLRQDMGLGCASVTPSEIATICASEIARRFETSLRRVFNLTGVVLHTNLGRAVLPQEAIAAASDAMRWPVNVEFDLEGGNRGYRDRHVQATLSRHSGAESSSIVNNNAAAVFLVLNTLAAGREVIVSRGELIEIGGAFRLPDIIARAGCRLVEVGTTNRTHLRDYERAIGPDTALVLKTHTSNYRISGFVSEVRTRELKQLTDRAKIPLIEDLGSGTLTDMATLQLPAERTVRQVIDDGADVVTFSGDKLLGGPQVGIIAARAALISQMESNPLKRVLRVDKIRLAALDTVLRLYDRPDYVQAIPTLRQLTRSAVDIEAVALELFEPMSRVLRPVAQVAIEACASQVGSGALPLETLPSAAIRITPAAGISVGDIVSAFRSLPIPVIGRIKSNVLLLDLRCLDEVDLFVLQLDEAAASFEALARTPRDRAIK